MKWEIVPRDEQETLISINYCEKTMTIYTSRKATAIRLIRKIGEPTRVDYNNGFVTGIAYERSLFDKDVAKFFSKTLIIGTFRKEDGKNE